MQEPECKFCRTQVGIVHSGTDGIYLGCLEYLHKICYDCANALFLEIDIDNPQ